MGLEIIKKGQGTWARVTAYVLGGILVVLGAFALYGTINRPNEFVIVDDLPLIGALSGYKVIAAVVGLAGLLGLHLVLNRPNSVDLMIETEQEMRRVSWPTSKEVWNATIVVSFVSLLLAVAMSSFDWILRKLFHLVF